MHLVIERNRSFLPQCGWLQTFIHQLSLIFDILGSPEPHEVAHIRNNKAKRFLRSKRDKIKVMSSKRRMRGYGPCSSCSLYFFPPWSSCLAEVNTRIICNDEPICHVNRYPLEKCFSAHQSKRWTSSKVFWCSTQQSVCRSTTPSNTSISSHSGAACDSAPACRCLIVNSVYSTGERSWNTSRKGLMGV